MEIDAEQAKKLYLRVGEIVAAEEIKGSEKLLKLQVDLGTEKRQLVAGIRAHYSPEQLVGKKIIVVANLKPAKLFGVESQGMLLAAQDESTVSLLIPDREAQKGQRCVVG